MPGSRNSKAGATIVESCLVMVLLCLILFGIIQVSILTAASGVLVYASSAGVRCATVGYDDDMVRKTVQVAALPLMGSAGLSWAEEKDRIEEFLQNPGNFNNTGPLRHIPDVYWDSLKSSQGSAFVDRSGGKVEATVIQEYPMTLPFLGALYGETTTRLSVETLDPNRDSNFTMKIEDHSDLYLSN